MAKNGEIKIKRHQLGFYLKVYNHITGRILGYIVNISPQGMMLVSSKRLLTHALFDLEIRLPEPINGKKKITVQALSHWCQPDLAPNCFDTGFSFVQSNDDLLQLGASLSQYFSFKSESINDTNDKQNPDAQALT